MADFSKYNKLASIDYSLQEYSTEALVDVTAVNGQELYTDKEYRRLKAVGSVYTDLNGKTSIDTTIAEAKKALNTSTIYNCKTKFLPHTFITDIGIILRGADIYVVYTKGIKTNGVMVYFIKDRNEVLGHVETGYGEKNEYIRSFNIYLIRSNGKAAGFYKKNKNGQDESVLVVGLTAKQFSKVKEYYNNEDLRSIKDYLAKFLPNGVSKEKFL